MKLLAIVLLLSTAVFAQTHTATTVRPSVIPSTATDYETAKQLIIGINGVQVCPDKSTMYVGIINPKTQQGIAYFAKLGDKARLITTAKQEYIAICVEAKEK